MNTTLEIDTSQLELGVYSILCILQQSIPPEVDLEEGMDQPFSTTMTIVEPITTPSTTTTETTTEIMPTAATGNLNTTLNPKLKCFKLGHGCLATYFIKSTSQS